MCSGVPINTSRNRCVCLFVPQEEVTNKKTKKEVVLLLLGSAFIFLCAHDFFSFNYFKKNNDKIRLIYVRTIFSFFSLNKKQNFEKFSSYIEYVCIYEN